MQMHNGTRNGEGSFYVSLKECFYNADMKNRRKLVEAFPEFFGDELPEFGITGNTKLSVVQALEAVNKTFKYKGWLCGWNSTERMYFLYTPDELKRPSLFRIEEFECETKEQCKQFIDSY
jgi:hypothetical protein